MYKRITKRYDHNKQRPSRFEETREYQLAEQWFKERRSIIKAPITDVCEKCFISTDNPIKMLCCKSAFCSECYSERAELCNRCNTCNTVIDFTKYELYDGFELKIPTYDEFYYDEPFELMPIILEPLEAIEEDYIGQLNEQDIDRQYYLMLNNAIMYLQSVIYYTSYASSSLS
jgi:hypothetical protein